MGLGSVFKKFMPAREDAMAKLLPQIEDDHICDLDVVLDKPVTFTFRGNRHELLPITTERWFEFWQAQKDFGRIVQDRPQIANSAYFVMIKKVCKTISLKDVEAMSIVQKGLLLEHITAKMVGKNVVEFAKEKKKILESKTAIPTPESKPAQSS